MTCRFVARLGLLALFAALTGGAMGATFALINGDVLEGEPLSANMAGLIVMKADGNPSVRVAWTNFTQDALKQLSTNKTARAIASQMIEVEEPDEDAIKAALQINPVIPDRLDRPDPKAGMGALFGAPMAVVILLLIYAGNVYAGYEIGVFRNYPPFLVSGVAAVAPVIGPVVFLCLPTRLQKSQDEIAAETMAKHLAELADQEASAAGNAVPEAAAVEEAAPVDTGPKSIIYTRGQTTFNRRFFETKFAGFFRMVPGDAEKDMLIHVRSARGDYSGPRISRIQPNELYLQVSKEGATADVMIPFIEISEVQIRHKDT